MAEVNTGRPINNEIHDLLGLIGKRAILHWQDKEKGIIKLIELIPFFSGEERPGTIAIKGIPMDNVVMVSNCPCN